jgi:hypothetical protein
VQPVGISGVCRRLAEAADTAAGFAYALSMPSALAALITPGWYYPSSRSVLESATVHTILVLIPVLFVCGDGFRPDYRRLPKVSLLSPF